MIYKLLEDIQLAMEGLLNELVDKHGRSRSHAVFTTQRSGCYVTTGKLQRNCKVRVHRGKEIVYAGDLDRCDATRTTSKRWPQASNAGGNRSFCQLARR